MRTVRSVVTFLVFGALAFLAGCATLPSPEKMQTETAGFRLPGTPDPGKAMVYVVRPSILGSLIRFNVFVDTQETASEMGYTRGGEYIFFQVVPGQHTIYSKAENWAEARVSLRAGEIAYLSQDPTMGLLMAQNSLLRLEEVVGKYHVKTLAPGTILQTASASAGAAVVARSPSGSPLDPAELFRQADPSVVLVSAAVSDGTSQGSGVIVAPNDVVTNCHVVKDASRIRVWQAGEERDARLRFQDESRDLCQLRLNTPLKYGRPIAGIAPPGEVEVGQTVYAISAPQGLDHTLARGIVSALRPVRGEAARLIQTDAAISPGSSGGGLFDSQGRLIGIITFQVKDGQNLNFVIPAQWIQELGARNTDQLGIAETPVIVAADPELAWIPREGDKFIYTVALGRQLKGRMAVEVMESRDKRVKERLVWLPTGTIAATRDVQAGFAAERFLAPVAFPGSYQLLEFAPYPQPDLALEPGTRWIDVPGEVIRYQIGKTTVRFAIRVIGRKMVNVPAGTFDAYHIEAKAVAEGVNSTILRITADYWYAPKIRRTVRMTLRNKTDYEVIDQTETYELAAVETGR